MPSDIVNVSRWLKLEANRPINQRLRSLKIRTFLTAVVAMVCGFSGAVMLAGPMATLCRIAYGKLFQHGSFPLVHTPIDSSLYAGYPILQLTFLSVAIATILGASAGAFGRIRSWQFLIPSLCLGLATLVFIPPTTSWLGVLPSQLERSITRGDFETARELLKEAGPNETVTQYIQAQIALRTHDTTALKMTAGPVLSRVDEWSSGQTSGSVRDTIERKRAVVFSPEIIYALDVALNGQATTKMAKEWMQGHGNSLGQSLWLAVIIPLCFGGLLLAAAFGLIPFWNGMRRRVREIQIGLAQDLEIALPSGSKPNEVLSNSDHASSPSFSSSRVFSGIAIAIAVAVVVVPQAIKAVNWVLSFRSVITHTSISDNPCDYAGVWTAAQKRGVYKITLLGDGRFFAEPIAAGSTGGQSYEGEWSVDGGSMVWSFDQQLDVNKIKEASRTHFTLVERDGELTDFNLIKAEEASSCSKDGNWISAK